MFSRVVWVPRNDPIETSSSSCLVICKRAFGVAGMVLAVYESETQESFFFVSVSSPRIVATLHITFSWLSLPIGQVCSQVWCRSYLAAHFGFFNLGTFPWSLKSSPSNLGTFYPYILKVGSKCTYIIHTSSSVKPSIVSTRGLGPPPYLTANKPKKKEPQKQANTQRLVEDHGVSAWLKE